MGGLNYTDIFIQLFLVEQNVHLLMMTLAMARIRNWIAFQLASLPLIREDIHLFLYETSILNMMDARRTPKKRATFPCWLTLMSAYLFTEFLKFAPSKDKSTCIMVIELITTLYICNTVLQRCICAFLSQPFFPLPMIIRI